MTDKKEKLEKIAPKVSMHQPYFGFIQDDTFYSDMSL